MLGPEIGQVALSFQSKHPISRLRAVTDLATDNAATLIIAAFSEDVNEPGNLVRENPWFAVTGRHSAY
jgi:hypothetical protein